MDVPLTRCPPQHQHSVFNTRGGEKGLQTAASGGMNAGLPAFLRIRSSPPWWKKSETPKSHSLTIWREAERRMLSGLI